MIRKDDPSPPGPTIGILTALPKECAAVRVMLDHERRSRWDDFYLGEIAAGSGVHHVVVGLLLDMGNSSAAIVATRLLAKFPTVKDLIMCGIAGGVPRPGDVERDVRLGDIVVSDRNGVVQFDLVKERPDGSKEHRHPPRPPSARLLRAARHLRVEEEMGQRPWEAHLPRGAVVQAGQRPADHLDARGRVIEYPEDPQRRSGLPRVFHGTVAASNTLLKNSQYRDYLGETFGVKCVEMEGSGVADATWTGGAGYLVVRGICDYCDENKGDLWQGAAAVAAAAYVRALVASMQAAPQDGASAEVPGPAVGAAPTATSAVGNITAGAGATVQVTVNTTAAPGEAAVRADRATAPEEPARQRSEATVGNPSTLPSQPSPTVKNTILFLAANPHDVVHLELALEARSIQEELERSGFGDRFKFETRLTAEPLDLLRELRRLKPVVVHFSGHGGRDLHSGDAGFIVLQNSQGGVQRIYVEALQQAFGVAGTSVKLVVLNTSYSDVLAEALVPHVSCVVGMSESITDQAARIFSIGFYGSLGEGDSIDAAVRQGCAAVSLHGISSFAQPQLFVRDGVDASKLVLAADASEQAVSQVAPAITSQPSWPSASPASPSRLSSGIQTEWNDVSLPSVAVNMATTGEPRRNTAGACILGEFVDGADVDRCVYVAAIVYDLDRFRARVHGHLERASRHPNVVRMNRGVASQLRNRGYVPDIMSDTISGFFEDLVGNESDLRMYAVVAKMAARDTRIQQRSRYLSGLLSVRFRKIDHGISRVLVLRDRVDSSIAAVRGALRAHDKKAKLPPVEEESSLCGLCDVVAGMLHRARVDGQSVPAQVRRKIVHIYDSDTRRNYKIDDNFP